MFSLKQWQNFISQISNSRGLKKEDVENALLDALAIAYKKDSEYKDGIIKAVKGKNDEVDFYLVKTVVDDNEAENPDFKFNPHRQIFLSDAKKIKENIGVGEELLIPLPKNENFSRIAAQTAKQLIVQKLREAEKKSLYFEFKEKENKIVTGVIERRDNNGNVYVNLGKTLGIMFRNETIPGEIYKSGQRMRFYVYAVENTPKGVQVFLSRFHPYLVAAIFSMEVAEINDGVIEIKAVAREPGVRSKIAVSSKVGGFDAVGACIGVKGARVISIMNELNNEKIDIVLWDEDPLKFVANALSPAKVLETKMMEKRTILALVPEEEIPLAIGKNGQNIKLAAKLTGWQIDVRSASNPEEKIEDGTAMPDEENKNQDELSES